MLESSPILWENLFIFLTARGRFKDTPGFWSEWPYKRHKNKRISYLIDSFARLPEIRFYIQKKNKKWGASFHQNRVKYTGSTLWRFRLKSWKIDNFEN